MYTGNSIYDIQNCISFLEEADLSKLVVAYPVGRHIGVRDLKTNEMKFIRQHENLKEITGLCLSPNKKFLATCETQKDDKSAYITFYDMKSTFYKNTQNHINVCEGQTPTNQRYIVSIAFSNDSKYVVCLLMAPDCKALAYEWFKKNRVISSFDFHKQGKQAIVTINRDNEDNVPSKGQPQGVHQWQGLLPAVEHAGGHIQAAAGIQGPPRVAQDGRAGVLQRPHLE